MALYLKLWGVRGSLPTPQTPETIKQRITSLCEEAIASGIKQKNEVRAFIDSLPFHKTGGFGGHTACVEVATPEQTLIIDAGSGIRPLAEKLMATPLGKGKGKAHIFFTHFHWDHLIGLPFFIPIFIPGNEIHFYAVQPELEEVIRGLFKKPQFPVPFEQLGAKIFFHKLEPRVRARFGDLELTPYLMDHPDPCWGYRIEHGGRAVAYCVDTECTRTSRQDLGDDLPLYQNLDAMVFDAQYTINEATEKVNWGHAAAPFGLDVAKREGIKQVYFIHHDPSASDARIAEAEKQTREYYESTLKLAKEKGRSVSEVDWKFAQEGQEIILEPMGQKS